MLAEPGFSRRGLTEVVNLDECHARASGHQLLQIVGESASFELNDPRGDRRIPFHVARDTNDA